MKMEQWEKTYLIMRPCMDFKENDMRLIDADELIEIAHEMIQEDPDAFNGGYSYDAVTVEEINEAPTVEAVPVAQLESVLKEAYLEIANGYSVSDLQSDSDKVACVASKLRQTVLDKLRTSEK